METILEEDFNYLIMAAGGLYILLGLALLFYEVPKTKIFAPYRLSKLLLAICFWLVSGNLWLWLYTFDLDWHNAQPLTACIDLILFYMAGILLSYSFSNLLDRSYLTRRRVAIDLTKWGCSSAIALLAMTDGMAAERQGLLLVSLLFLVEFFVRYLFYFRKTYIKSSEILDNYYCTDKSYFIQWIKRSIALIFIYGIVGIISINTGIYINWLYQIYAISMNIYIALSFMKYAKEYDILRRASVENASEEVTNTEGINTEEVNRNDEQEAIIKKEKDSSTQKKTQVGSYQEVLKPRVAAWIKSKRYAQEQFTIEELATFLGTNKYYLSKYIKDTYDVNFSTWVATLRINEAKRIMQEEPNKLLEEVAYSVGFSSLSYFSKVFTKLEGVSPSAWLRERSL